MNLRQEIGRGVVLLFFLGIFHSANAQSNDCAITWNPSIRISFDSLPSNVPQIAVSGDTVHLVWLNIDDAGADPNGGVQYSHSYDGGLTFSPQARLVPFDSTSPNGVFMACKGNYVNVVFLASVDTFYGTALIRSTDAGTTWEPSRFLLGFSRPLIAAGEGAHVYIHYLNQSNNLHGLLRSDDNGETWHIAAPSMPALSDISANPIQLHGVGSVGSIAHPEVEYYYSNDLGVNWVSSDLLSREDPFPSTLPRITSTDQNDLIAIWNDTGSIVARRSKYDENEGVVVWLPETVISTGGGAVFSDISSSGEFVSIVWDNDFGGTGGIRFRHSNTYAASFCPIDLPSASTNAAAPSIQLAGSRIHLVWSEQVGSHSEIFYRQGALQEHTTPPTFSLRQNYPNPFNNSTRILFDLPVSSNVSLIVYNLLGQKVAIIYDNFLQAQTYDVAFDGTNLSSGVYFYRLQTSQFQQTRKMLLIK